MKIDRQTQLIILLIAIIIVIIILKQSKENMHSTNGNGNDTVNVQVGIKASKVADFINKWPYQFSQIMGYINAGKKPPADLYDCDGV